MTAIVERLAGDLRHLGVRPGDTVMVHASLRAIGRGEPGGRVEADVVVDAIDRALGPEGTWLMVLGASEAHGRFEALTTPVLEEVGTLAEVFRRRPGTIVTPHPEGRFGARGASAGALLADPPWHDYYGRGSALERLCAWGGKVVRMGASPETTTVLHYAEQRLTLPGLRRVTRTPLVRTDDGGAMRVMVQTLDDENGVVDWPGEDYFATILRDYLAARIGSEAVQRGQVGGADSVRIDANDLVGFGVEWMTRAFAPIVAAR